MSSPIGQAATFGMYQNSGRFNVKFSSFDNWYYVSTVNIAISWHEFCSLTSTVVILKLAPDSLKYRSRNGIFIIPTALYITLPCNCMFSVHKLSASSSN